jgi:hypothetical protein
MTLILSGTDGLSDVDGSAATPAIRGTDANTGIFFGADIIGFAEGGAEVARFNADAQFVAAAGTASLPVITTTGDVNTGIFFPAADTIAFTEGGVESMRITSAGDVGVGTTSPNLNSFNKELTVSAGTSGTARAGINIQGSRTTDSTFGALSYYHQANLVGSIEMIRGGADNSGAMQFFTANAGSLAERMRIDSSGNVGIGTNSPGVKLDIRGGGGTASTLRIGSDTNDIGTIQFFNTTGSTINATIAGNLEGGNAGGNLTFSTKLLAGSLAERARIDSSGNLLVGVTTPYRTGQSAISSTSVYGLRIQPTSASNGIALEINAPNVSSGTSSFLIAASAAGADKMYCYSNGNIVNVNNSYGTLSDVKLKENIVDASPKLADVMQLKVRNFNLKTEPDHKQIGFIAQELEQIFPALIDNTTSPNDPDDVIKSIKTSVLVPILVKAIQELKTLVDTQANTITQLQADVAALKGTA